MDHPIVADRRDIHTGNIEPTRVGLALVSQYVLLSSLYQRRRQALKLSRSKYIALPDKELIPLKANSGVSAK